MNERPVGSKELLSEESEDYTIDDIIQLHKIEEKTAEKGIPGKNVTATNLVNISFRPVAKTLDYNLSLENNDYNLKDIKDIEAVLKMTSNILATRVSNNVNRFSNMTHCEEVLQILYQSLENLSRNRGNSKEIIEIGTKIETVEAEKHKQFINTEEINNTIEDIKSVVSTLSKIQNILENSPK